MSVSRLDSSQNNILVVDDTPTNLHLLAKMLSGHGYTVRLAPSGSLALKSVRSTLPDLILLDIKMPDMDGYEVCKALKADERTRAVPVIFLSALRESDDKVKAFAVGGVDYITKPFQVEEVIIRVEHQLNLLRLQRQLVQQKEQLVQQNLRLQQEIQERERALSDRQQAETALQQAHQQLWFHVENTPLATLEWDHEFRLRHWSAQAERIFGWTAAEVLGKGLYDFPFVHVADREQVNQTMTRLARGQATRNLCSHRNYRKNGAVIACEWYNSAMFDASGKLVSVLSLIQDVTERKQAEEVLQQSADRERAVLKLVEHMRQTLDIEQIFNATTHELQTLLKCDRVVIFRFNPDGRGEWVAEAVAPDWQPLLPKTAVVPPSPGNLAVTRSHHPPILPSTLSSPASPIALPEVLDRHLVDAYLQAIQAEIQHQSQPYLLTSDIYSLECEPAHLQLLEWLQAKAYLIVPIFLGEQRWGLMATYQNSGPRAWKATEINLVSHISTQLGVALQQAELLVQTQKQSDQLEKAKNAADAANRAKSEFLTNMSHELRTPLNAILGFTEVMSRDTSLNGQISEYLSIITRSGEHLLDLINDVLEMSKIEAGRTSLNLTNFDLHHFLNTLEEMLRLKAERKGLQLVCDRAPDLPQFVCTDESKLRQVLINLLGNAIKFTEQGSVKLRVRLVSNAALPQSGAVQSRSSPEFTQMQILAPRAKACSAPVPTAAAFRLEFEVEDTGPGIETADLESLFEPFVQAKQGQKLQEGTGLGLPISRQFVRLMGGEISVQSVLREGSIFRFQVPIAVICPIAPPAQPSKRRVVELEPGQPVYRLLVVEDKRENRWLLVDLLQRVGFEVREAENGQAAIELCQTWEPHLVWMDMRMPVMDGYEATRQIKAMPNGQQTIIIALTATAFEETRTNILTAGCNDFVSKPFRMDTIFAKVAEHLGVRYRYADTLMGEDSGRSNLANSLPTDRNLPAPIAIDLTIMPPDWLNQLHQAAIKGSDEQILTLIEQIPASHLPLARILADWANNFRFDKVIELVEQTTE